MSTTAPISGAARSAITQAIATLRPFASEPRVQAIINSLNYLAPDLSPDVQKAEALAEELRRVDRATEEVAKAEGMMSRAAQDARQARARATRKAQAEYLDAVGGNAEAWRQQAREIGRA